MRVRRLAGARRGGGSPWPPRIGGGRVCVAVLELCCGGTAMLRPRPPASVHEGSCGLELLMLMAETSKR